MRRRATVLAIASIALVVLSACGDGGGTKPGLGLNSPSSGSTIHGNVVRLALDARHITIVKADGDTSGKTGHFHVFIDRDPVPVGTLIPKLPGIVVHSAANPIVLRGLSTGRHRLAVVLGDGAHRRIGKTKVVTTVNIAGPAVTASAPEVVLAGQPVVISLRAQGVEIAKANGDTSGKTAHFHLFVDREPTPASEPIPKEPGIIHTTDTAVSIPGLAPGEHTVIVVLGDGAHVPLSPPAEAQVSFTVQ